MKLKKWVALLLVSVLMVSLTGCMGQMYENAGTIDGEEISSGLYLMAQMAAYNEARNLVDDAEKDVLKQKVEGENAKSWITNRTEELLLRFVVVQRIAKERTIYLSEESKAAIEENMGYWSMASDYYINNGISQKTLERFMVNEALTDQLFDELFGKDGELASSDEEMMKEYAEKFAHIRFISIPKNSLDETVTVDADKLNAQVKTMLESLKSGNSMGDVAEKQLQDAYKILGREFDPATAATHVTTSFINLAPDDFETYSEEFLKTLASQKVGEFGSYEMESTILLYEKIEVFETQEDFEQMRSTIIRDLRKDAFEEYLANIYSAYEVKWEPGVRWFLRPGKIKS